jgi:hypothetical protein
MTVVLPPFQASFSVQSYCPEELSLPVVTFTPFGCS